MNNELTSEIKKARPVSGERLSMFEIELPSGEFEYFSIVYSDNYIFVANYDGSDFEAYMERDKWFDLDYNLQLFHALIVQQLENGEEVAGELY